MFGDGYTGWNILIYPLLALFYLQLIRHLSQSNLAKQPISDEEYLTGIARVRGCSEYDLFFEAAKEWRIASKIRIEEDFNDYLRYNAMPYYVKDFARKHRTANSRHL
jgi:hypothetical protein